MSGINKVIIVGRLGNDPEVRYMPSGGAVITISVATSESWTDKVSGQKQERTEWHRITLFNKLGEIAGEYLKKGSQVYIEGRLQTRKWQDKQGNDRYSTDIIAKEMQMLGNSGVSNSSSGSKVHSTASYPQQDQAPESSPTSADADIDDIPF